MLTLPVYKRNQTYYFHTRYENHQVKRSLNTKDPDIAMIRALELLKVIDMTIDLKKIKKYEIDLGRGVFKSNGREDHADMMDALSNIDRIGLKVQHISPPAPIHGGVSKKTVTGLRLPEIVEKFFNLKKQLKQATALSYKKTVNEFSGFAGNQYISEYDNSDITRYMEHLATFNETRTIDSKIGILNTIFNFAIKQGYYFKDNPAADRRLMSKKDRAKNGYGIFEIEEIQKIFAPEHLAIFKQKDPDFYYCILIALITGARSSEITSLESNQLKDNPPHLKIRDSKTLAGIRDIPIPQHLFMELKAYATGKDKLFRYTEIAGKGTGNAVGKKFKRHLDLLKINRDKLVFHSLRKFCNEYLKNQNIQIEARCQLLGHELDNVNVSTYSREYSIKDLAKLVNPVQAEILKLIKFE
ncbi:MAG: tyrosine-type recombinase/integrase [Methylotenera sp.]|nr:tyrosine-type recombinase/integrase [Methylotenera sp.]MDD4924964.1 tyrosine-type recombinase/integrase [Methylotenera sp.]